MQIKTKKKYFAIILFAITMASMSSLFIFQLAVEDDGFFVAEVFNHNHLHKSQKSAPGPDPRPSEWGWLQRVFPHGTADKMAHLEAIDAALEMRKSSKARAQSTLQMDGLLRDAAWKQAGPTNIGGRISDIEYNPHNSTIVYAGAATGGVFKSVDGGYSWEPVFDDQASLTIGDIALDPINPDIIYVGTGEANGGHNNFPGGGMYKSSDGGQTWRLLGFQRTASIGRIVVDPHYPQRVFAAVVGSYFGPDPERGVYFSPDGGLNWKKSLFVSDSTGAIDLIINPQNPQMMLAAMWERVRGPHTSHLYGPTSGIYRTIDGGLSWTKLGAMNGLPEGDPLIGRIGLALCHAHPYTVYALFTDGYTYKAFYRSDDGGLNWRQVDPWNQVAGGVSSFSWYFGNIRVHPTDPDKVFALDVAFMKSNDGGQNWPIIYGYGSPYPNLHVDQHALAFHPLNPEIMLVGNDGGINITYNGGQSWEKVGQLPITQFYEMTMDFTNPERLYGGTQDNGTLRTMTGQLDDWEEIYGGDGFFVLVDPTDPNIIYAEYQWGGLGKSTNGGIFFRGATSGINSREPTNWSTPVIMDPNHSNILYYGTDRVYRTVNGADYWQPVSADLTKQLENSRLGTVTAIAVAPADSAVIYAGTDDGNVWVTQNWGQDWVNVTNGLPFRWVTRLAVDPADAAIAYATFSGMKWKSPQSHVFRTQNSGETWVDISSNLPDAPVNTIAVDPLYPNNLYLGSDVGCFFSVNAGQSWDILGTGLPVVPVYSMVVHPTLRRLAIGTYGRSMYTIDLENIHSNRKPEYAEIENINTGQPADFGLLQNFPNPFNSSTSISYTLGGNSHVSIRIINSLGQIVNILVDEEKESGAYRTAWLGQNEAGQQVASGIYYCQLKTQNFRKLIRMVYLQ